MATSTKAQGHAAANDTAVFSGGPSLCTQGTSLQTGGVWILALPLLPQLVNPLQIVPLRGNPERHCFPITLHYDHLDLLFYCKHSSAQSRGPIS